MNTNKLVTMSLALGLSVFAACGGDSTTPSASGVFPAQGFAGRTLRVEVSGDATSWKDGATVDFGAGVTVNSVEVASATDLFADVTIDPGATIGKNDVTVTSGGKFTLKQAFEIVSPITTTTTGMVAQGSIASFSIRGLDFEQPFDSTCGFSFFGQCFLYTNLTVNTPPGVTAQVQFVGDYVVQGALFIDVDAAAAGGAFTVVSGPMGGTQVVSTAGDVVAITARSAIALTAGSPHSGAIVKPGDTALFSFSATAGTAVPFLVSTVATPSLYLLPSSGHFADLLSTGASDSNGSLLQLDAVAENAGSYYVIYADDGSMSGYTINAAPVTLTSVAEGAAANDTAGTAQTVTKTALVTGGNLSSTSDQDWYQFPIAVGDVGKKVHVTTAGDPQTDTLVDIFSAPAGGATPTTTSIGESPDGGFQEDFVSDAIPTGTTVIYVEISASQAGFFNPGHSTYSAAIWLE